MKRLRLALTCLAVLSHSLLSFSDSFLPENRADGLKVSTPKALGVDEKLLTEGFERARRLPYSHSLLVQQAGKLIAEEYFHGYSVKSPNNIKSVTKSVTSTLIGIAIDRKVIASIDLPVRKFLPDIFSRMKDPKKDQVTLKDLLTMSAGFDANDDLPDLNSSAHLDHAASAFERPLIHTPGEMFSYTSAYVDALSRILTEVSGKSTREFAQAYLFRPLGIADLGWSRDALGYYLGESDLFLTSRDMVKFGELFLNKGKYQGRQIVSQKWVEESTTPKIKASEGNGEYGYLWWMKLDAKIPFIYAWGLGGQYIYIVPSKNGRRHDKRF